eukprot:8785202-Prorocentrum_lima.AAC.1
MTHCLATAGEVISTLDTHLSHTGYHGIQKPLEQLSCFQTQIYTSDCCYQLCFTGAQSSE